MWQARWHQARFGGSWTPRRLLHGAAALGLATLFLALAAPGGAAPIPNTLPVFTNGLAQSVFSNATALHGEAWVEVPGVDSDWDGIPDRVHFDITRPLETQPEGLKVPPIFEASPYFANLGPNANYSVNPEVGFPP